ncbi:autotransporter beta-domain [Pseudomonas fluorescens]|uniref:Autotransporter beta-domain n=1 Tax=Pseudomonas fluorescens TaxID=294 RepID=A0A379IE85_PSEFL|nr:autotransporter outer membrane beta-barrel domain-containing protein [Pseudomonas fluorescens]AIG01332.1 transporter [Pseudomonas fluorescens]SUD31094.1 autotransporter beta-domain [Pseudomonas fluorescens]
MSTRRYLLPELGTWMASTILVSALSLPAYAACTPVITAGDDTTTCDSGSTPGFTDLSGNNTLNLPAGGNGSITSAVTFGDGHDLVQAHSGSMSALDMGNGANIFRVELDAVVGPVTQGDGADIAQVSGGTVGALNQGDGIDAYAQSGGRVASLAQGDGRDTFNMSGGEIVGAFEDGDVATQSAGTIGRVDMKLDNNFYTLLGGRINGNLVTGFGLDTISISGGYIGGNVSVSGGDDLFTLTGGTVNGQVLMSLGNDQFNWIGAGTLNSTVNMGPDNDTALLQNLTQATLAPTPLIDGGPGTDTLTFDNTQAGNAQRYANWETVNLDNRSRFALAGDWKLGGSDTGTGTLNIDGSSVLLVSQGAITPFAPGQLATLNNSGLIDMTSASTGATDSLTVHGNYNGNNGQLALQSVLAGDDSASDKLVVSQGTLQGSTTLTVSNLGGSGGATLSNGIQVVQALNGATGSDRAFTLAGGSVSAGAFEYFLFKGGVSPGSEQQWYLRSTVVAPPLPDPEGPVSPLPEPVPGEGAPIELPKPIPGEAPIPIYRPEVPVYSTLFPAAQQTVRGMLGTYHERMGDQTRQTATGSLPAGWGRVYGNSRRQAYAGTVSPRLDSSLSGFQVGSDIQAWSTGNGQVQRLGFFVGHSRLRGNVDGFNRGWQHLDAGNTTLRGDSLGLYWTLIDPNGWYVDGVLMGTRLNGNSESDRGLKLKAKGHDVLGSVEVGMPLPITQNWVLEPQLQLIVNKTRLDSQHDGVSKVAFSADTAITTRLGARLRGSYTLAAMPLQPYLRANVWHASSGTDRVRFNDVTAIDTEQKSTTLDVSAGAMVQVSDSISLYGELGYGRNLDSNALNGRSGTVGVRMEF